MKTFQTAIALLLTVLLLTALLADPLLARGVGGGGRGGGGAARAGGGMRGGGASPSFGGGGAARAGGGRAAPSFGAHTAARPASISRPSASAGARPGFVPQGRPGAGSASRPSLANRPSTLPAVANRPSIGTGSRPGGGAISRPGAGGSGIATLPSRPDIRPGGGGSGADRFPNRPDVRPGGGGSGTDRFPNRPDNRPDWANRPNIGGGNINVNNNNINNIVNRPGFRPGYDRPWGNNRPWNRPYYHYGYGWHSGYWNNWARYPGLWFAAGASTSWLWGPGDTYVYSNPYYVQSTTVVDPTLDYSQPIAVPAPEQVAEQPPPQEYAADGSAPAANEPPAEPQGDPVPPEVDEAFSAARTAFKAGDYSKALDQVNRAIKVLPGDATLHEFRALVLFAQGKYQEGAAAIYAVLAVGPGWNWETVRDLYPNTETYTKQLRALEQYIREHPTSPDARFLLAYHYLVMGQMDPAKTELAQVVKLEPKDKLSAQLLKALKQGPTENGPTQS